MKSLALQRQKLKLTVSVYSLLLLVLTALWLYSGYLFVSSQADSESAVPRPAENYYQLIAQFEHSVARAEIATLQYGAGQVDLGQVSVQFQVLQSKLTLLASPADATFFLQKLPRYRQSVAQLEQITAHIMLGLDAMRGDRTKAWGVAAQFDAMREPLENLEESIGNADGKRRDEAHADYMRRREMLVRSGLGATLILLLLAYLLLVNARRVRALVVQQRVALERETEAALAATAAVNAKNAFLGMIGHELRTPLQSIMAATDVLAERDFNGAEKMLIEQLARAADVLDTQMKDLNDFSRMEAGKLTLRMQAFSPYDVIAAAVESVAERARRKGLRLKTVAEGMHTINLSDPYRIQQIIANLLVNAIKYTEQGEVRIRANVIQQLDHDEFTVAVEDTGPGIEPGKIDGMFMPFTQLDSSSTRRYDGIGMGLAIVKGLTNLLGASVRVESEVGKGSTFIVTFPLERAHGQALSPRRETQEVAALADKLVLVVDDQESVRHAIGALLSARGIKYTTASDAWEALAAAATQQFDAVLLDINMPDKDGIAVAREIRQTVGVNQYVPILGCSAIAPELLSKESRGLFGSYLMKPVRAETLKLALDAIWAEPDLPQR